MKVSARLIKAIIALAVSVVLSIGVCLAWFVTNGNVDADGLDSFIKSTNISDFKITAYYLTNPVEADGVVSYTVGDESEDHEMLAYGNIDDSATALLLKFECTFIDVMGKNYDISASFTKKIKDEVEANTGEYDLKCNLSEVLDFFKVVGITGTVAEGDTVTLGDELAPNEDKTEIDLNGSEATDNPLKYTFYCIIDYNEEDIQAKYFYALNNVEGCSLSSKMRFENNMSFYVAEA